MDHGYSSRQDRLAYLNTHASLPAMAEVALFVAVTWTKWAERRQMRKNLRDLPEFRLKDIGVTKSEADLEADKPFWKG
ncbi:DUF1127 domain-containing protein [Aliiroseovarius sp. KMU-50]|uniref:DUF1127 domain-containing protein n=1 Tax=Aliiroseovarius salicola TaxID=3009082 RepID=A0ABT4W591_9RHOB|nr:DUF1127 domain-containing protein [Aliiroseovarius sp. KMU-50]MDA5095686.1 DUF1127 domain-containing protein [Aliiroseovarius sp. KMU-50]